MAMALSLQPGARLQAAGPPARLGASARDRPPLSGYVLLDARKDRPLRVWAATASICRDRRSKLASRRHTCYSRGWRADTPCSNTSGRFSQWVQRGNLCRQRDGGEGGRVLCDLHFEFRGGRPGRQELTTTWKPREMD